MSLNKKNHEEYRLDFNGPIYCSFDKTNGSTVYKNTRTCGQAHYRFIYFRYRLELQENKDTDVPGSFQNANSVPVTIIYFQQDTGSNATCSSFDIPQYIICIVR